MRGICKEKRAAKRLMLLSVGAAIAAVIFYCVPWWIFLAIGVVSLLAAGFLLVRQ